MSISFSKSYDDTINIPFAFWANLKNDKEA